MQIINSKAFVLVEGGSVSSLVILCVNTLNSGSNDAY